MLTRISRADAPSATALALARSTSVVVCVPTLNEAATIGPICRELVALRDAGAIDRVVVLDDSTDATPSIAEAEGAEVVRQQDIRPDAGPVRGKGDAMWRGLSVCDEEIVAFVDGDSRGFRARMASDLVAAVALDGFDYAKATYRRPWATGDAVLPTGGGRVTELTAKPLLASFIPQLRAFEQPLAGEFAARADLLRALPFATGYAVDVALLIDAWSAIGIERMVEVDLGQRQNRHRPLAELGAMAVEVTAAILDRAGVEHAAEHVLVERPPLSLDGALPEGALRVA